MIRNLILLSLLSLLLSLAICVIAYRNNNLSNELRESKEEVVEYKAATIAMFQRQEIINNQLIALTELIKQHVIVLEKKHQDPSEITYLRNPRPEKVSINGHTNKKETIEI